MCVGTCHIVAENEKMSQDRGRDKSLGRGRGRGRCQNEPRPSMGPGPSGLSEQVMMPTSKSPTRPNQSPPKQQQNLPPPPTPSPEPKPCASCATEIHLEEQNFFKLLSFVNLFLDPIREAFINFWKKTYDPVNWEEERQKVPNLEAFKLSKQYKHFKDNVSVEQYQAFFTKPIRDWDLGLLVQAYAAVFHKFKSVMTDCYPGWDWKTLDEWKILIACKAVRDVRNDLAHFRMTRVNENTFNCQWARLSDAAIVFEIPSEEIGKIEHMFDCVLKKVKNQPSTNQECEEPPEKKTKNASPAKRSKSKQP